MNGDYVVRIDLINDPDTTDSWNNKGIALKALGRNTEADAAYDKAKELRVLTPTN